MEKSNETIENELEMIMNIISSIRNIKASFGISPKKEVSLFCKVDDKMAKILTNYSNYLERMVKVNNIESDINIKKPSQATTIVINNIEIYIPLKGLIDIGKEIERLNNQIQNLQGRLKSVDSKLNNAKFISNAPEKIVNIEKDKKARYEKEIDILQDNLSSLK